MQSDPISDNYYTTRQIAEGLGVKPATVRSWVRHGRVPFVRVGTILLFPKDAISVYLQKRLRV
jgi:excisionase family DNA binding protein